MPPFSSGRLVAALALTLPLLGACVPVLIATGAAGTAIAYHDRRTTGIQADDETSEWRGRNRLPTRYADKANVNFTSFNRVLLISGYSEQSGNGPPADDGCAGFVRDPVEAAQLQTALRKALGDAPAARA